MNYSKHVSTKSTPQTQPIPGSDQVANSAGGFSFQVTKWTQLERFLILGNEGGSYYASEQKMTLDNAKCVESCLKENGLRTITTIVNISDGGRAPKNDAAIFALAICLKHGDLETRRLAMANMPKVCRIGTHVFQLATAVSDLGGWGRITKKAFTGWYEGQTPDQLGMNLAKYQSRNGWSHRDILRKVKPKPKNETQLQSYRWAVGKLRDPKLVPEAIREGNEVNIHKYLPKVIQGFELAKAAQNENIIVKLITDFELPRECIPTQYLNSPAVWEALLMSGKGMPMTAMIRNLAKMTEVGLIKPLSKASKFIYGRLGNPEVIKKARVHPVALLMAQSIYGSGHGLKGNLTWEPDSNIVDALDSAFYLAFDNVEPTGKRFLLALDVSGSMSNGEISGTRLCPRDASAAMALVTAKTEQWHHIVGFTSSNGRGGTWGSHGRDALTKLNISPKMKLPEAIKNISDLPFGGTDCSLPMKYATENKLEVDCFVVFTDSETYAGTPHPSQALRDYRQKTGIPAKMIVCAMVSNEFTIADPTDAGMMDVCGFDTNVPSIIADFVK